MFSINESIRELVEGRIGGLGPVEVRFFTPTPAFYSAMEPFRDNIINEAGCGRGDTLVELREAGFKAAGCDLRVDAVGSIQRGIQRMCATRFPYCDRIVLLICRPDHSGWAEEAILKALAAGSTAIYVGLASNIERDFDPDVITQAVKQIDGVGQEGESMWIFDPSSFVHPEGV